MLLVSNYSRIILVKCVCKILFNVPNLFFNTIFHLLCQTPVSRSVVKLII